MMQKVKQFWQKSTRNKIVILVIVFLLVSIVGGYTQSWYFAWVGVGDFISSSGDYERGKTLWDWLGLAVIPLAFFFGARWFEQQARKRRIKVLCRQMGHRKNELALAAVIELAGLVKLDDETLVGAPLEWANLSKANLKGAKLNGADLHEAILIETNLIEAKLSGANLSGADLRGANLRGANLHGADLRRAKLQKAILKGADLREADLSRADLSGANLRGADLSGADLRDTNLWDTNLREANLSETKLEGAERNGGTDFPDDFNSIAAGVWEGKLVL